MRVELLWEEKRCVGASSNLARPYIYRSHTNTVAVPSLRFGNALSRRAPTRDAPNIYPQRRIYTGHGQHCLRASSPCLQARRLLPAPADTQQWPPNPHPLPARPLSPQPPKRQQRQPPTRPPKRLRRKPRRQRATRRSARGSGKRLTRRTSTRVCDNCELLRSG